MVDPREVGLVTSSDNKITSYSPGVHWKVPFIGDLTYVYTNMRSSYLASNQNIILSNGDKLSTKIVINWQVSQPSVYVSYLNAHSTKDFDIALAQKINDWMLNLATKSANIQDFEEQINANFINKPILSLGIKIINLGLIGALPVQNNVESNAVSSLVMDYPTQFTAESTYQAAMLIKTIADNQRDKALQKIQQRDKDFYAYFIKINNLGNHAESKGAVPEFDQLYPIN